MPITNIIDRRSNHYDVTVMVIFSDSSKDNWKKGTQFPFRNTINYLRIGQTTIADAFGYINQEYPNDDITMTLYDLDVNYHDYSTILKEGNRYTLPKNENLPITF